MGLLRSSDSSQRLETTIPYADSDGLQRDNHLDAPEVVSHDHTWQAPEVCVVDAGPQLALDQSYPIAITPTKADTIDSKVAQDIKSSGTRICGIPKKIFWTASSLISVILIVLAVILGVIMTRHSDKATPPPADAAPPNITSSGSRWSISDGSSLAVVQTQNGLRHLFFQDSHGDLRRMNIWTVSKNRTVFNNRLPSNSPIIATDARNETPLAVVAGINGGHEAMTLFYFNKANVLTSMLGLTVNWVKGVTINQISTTSTTRTLSVTVFNNTAASNLEALIFYENGASNVSVWHLAAESNLPIGDPRNHIGTDLSNALYASSANNIFRAPFTSSFMMNNLTSSIGLVSFDPHQEPTAAVLASTYNITGSVVDSISYRFGSLNDTSTTVGVPYPDIPIISINASGLLQSDTVLVLPDPKGTPVVMYVNGDVVSMLAFDNSTANAIALPSSQFSYPRLAALKSYDPTSPPCLYHQVNTTFFVEESYQNTTGLWNSTYFSIPSAQTA